MENNKVISTGIKGLDEILKGGLIPERFYLVRGGPGTGKTTIGAHFLIAGKKNTDKTLFITLTEPQEKIRYNAQNFNINLDNINFLDLIGIIIFVTISLFFKIVVPLLIKKSFNFTYFILFLLSIFNCEFKTINGGIQSAAGEAFIILPTTVPIFLICGDPISLQALTNTGKYSLIIVDLIISL